MSMRNRRTFRASVPRRRRFWTTSVFNLGLTGAAVGTGSQDSSTAVFTSVTTKLDTSILAGLTLVKCYLNGYWRTAADVAAPVVNTFSVGLGLFPSGIDDGDFPDLSSHTGDWVLHDSRPLVEVQSGGAVVVPLLPQSGEMTSGLRLESSGMRKLQTLADRPFVVAQKAIASEETITLEAVVTCLWVMS